MAQRMPATDLLKVDATAVSSENNTFVLIYNFNIPERYFSEREDDQDSERALRQVLERVRQCIVDEYSNISDIYYQFTATYHLVHIETGETRFFCGNFFPRGNTAASLTDFRLFVPDFVPFALQRLVRRRIVAHLRWADLHSKWQFESLASVIVNVQAVIPSDHNVFNRRRLYAARQRRRAHTVFELP